MPVVAFEKLPANARVWVFASDRALSDAESRTLLQEVDRFLSEWKAHGTPLRCGRDLRDNQFLAIGVDPTAEQASGCSIDVLFRGLQSLERVLGTGLVAGGRVFYRDTGGSPRLVARADVSRLAANGELADDTIVFDTSVTDAASWRDRFARPLRESWVAALVSSRVA